MTFDADGSASRRIGIPLGERSVGRKSQDPALSPHAIMARKAAETTLRRRGFELTERPAARMASARAAHRAGDGWAAEVALTTLS
jgi:hypothetical protein